MEHVILTWEEGTPSVSPATDEQLLEVLGIPDLHLQDVIHRRFPLATSNRAVKRALAVRELLLRYQTR